MEFVERPAPKKKESHNRVIIIVCAMVLVGFGAWYFILRPQSIRRTCNAIGIKHAREVDFDQQDMVYNLNYTACLHLRGL